MLHYTIQVHNPTIKCYLADGWATEQMAVRWNYTTAGWFVLLLHTNLLSYKVLPRIFTQTDVSLSCSRSPLTVPIVDQMNSVHILQWVSFKKEFNITIPSTSRSSKSSASLPFRSSNLNIQLHAIHAPSTRDTWPNHLIITSNVVVIE